MTDAELSRTLAQHQRIGALSTLTPEGDPYGSLVEFCADATGQPLLFLSNLAEHTQNFQHDPRASLMIWEPDSNPLMAGRVTLLGSIVHSSEGMDRYLEALPGAKRYKDFKDFQLYRLDVTQARYIGGFGRMSWVSAQDYALAESDPIYPIRSGILEHMNEDHRDAMDLLARHLGERPGGEWRMKRVDRDGYELVCPGQDPLRLNFDKPARTGEEIRALLVGQVTRCRKQEAGAS